MVEAARTHLTGKYSQGVAQMLWETDRYPLPDLQAVQAVLAMVARPQGVTGPDLAAALVLVQAARLTVDRLEADVTQAAREAGLSWEQLAAVLDLPGGGQEATTRFEEMLARRAAPNTEPIPHRLGPRSGPAAPAAPAEPGGERSEPGGS